MSNFVPNFVAMATRVGRGRMCLISLNSPTQKTPIMPKHFEDISYKGRVVADFVPNLVTMATGGWSWSNLASIIQQTDPENPLLYEKISRISLTKAEL